MHALIISGGKKVKKSVIKPLIEKADCIICADKGGQYAKDYHITPDFVVGDMDSIENKSFKDHTKILTYASKKDDTDTKIAVDLAIEKKATSIDMICATGTRMDHTMANIHLLAYLEEKNISARLIDDHNQIQICSDNMTIQKNNLYPYISILPFTKDVEGVTLKGFTYPLDNADISINWTQGISNQMVADHAHIHVKKGKLLVFLSRD